MERKHSDAEASSDAFADSSGEASLAPIAVNKWTAGWNVQTHTGLIRLYIGSSGQPSNFPNLSADEFTAMVSLLQSGFVYADANGWLHT
jgi:hypothetical protein